MASLPWQQYTERMVGRSHPTLADTNNRALRELLSQSGYDPDASPFPGLPGRVFNVLAFGAVGDGVTDDTTAIQAAIDAANAVAYGIVYIPAKDANNGYAFTQLKYYPGTHIVGDGIGGTFSGSRGTWLYQKNGTALEMLVPNDASVQTNKAIFEDFGLTAFNNQASNTGGIRLERAHQCKLERVAVTYTNVYGIQLKGGTSGGDTMYNTFISCDVSNQSAAASCWLLTSSASSQPDATTLIDCHINVTSATWVTVTGTASRGADTLRLVACHFIAGASVIAFQQGGTNAEWIGNRFETIGGAFTMTVNIVPDGGTTSPSSFSCNNWAAPSGLVWNDTQAGVRRSSRIAEFTTGGVVNFIPAPEVSIFPITYSASMAPNHEAQVNTIVATNGTAFTITNGSNRRTGRRTVIDLKNSSGGALGAITLGAAYLTAGAIVAPANTKRRLYEFYDDGTNLIETYRSAADI